MKEIVYTRRFERDFRRLKKRQSPYTLDYETLEYVFELLQREASLPDTFREHRLGREYAGFFECHVDADWLLVYRVTQSNRLSPHRYTSRPVQITAATFPQKTVTYTGAHADGAALLQHGPAVLNYIRPHSNRSKVTIGG